MTKGAVHVDPYTCTLKIRQKYFYNHPPKLDWITFQPSPHRPSTLGPFSGTTRVSRYQKGKTNLDFTEARDNEWQWHQLGHMQVCTSLHTDNHARTSPLSFLQAGCPSCRPTNSVKALKALGLMQIYKIKKLHGIPMGCTFIPKLVH